jgi:hypothetical protein
MAKAVCRSATGFLNRKEPRMGLTDFKNGLELIISSLILSIEGIENSTPFKAV